MGRPSRPVGSWGKLTVLHTAPGVYEARARYRDPDGVTRLVSRRGQTKTAATNALLATLTERAYQAQHTGIGPNSTVEQLADAWLASDAVAALAPTSIDTYTYAVEKQIKPRIRALRLTEFTSRRVNDTLAAVRADTGPGAAKMTKSALAGMCRLAISYEAITTNPMHDAISIKRTTRKEPRRILAPDEETRLCDLLRTDHLAVDYDLPDLVDWLLGTGCRIGEALAARDGTNPDGEPLLDLEAGTWEVNATLIRVKGRGLILQERTKSDAGWRRIAIPDHLVQMVHGRRERIMSRPDVPVLFPSPDPRQLRSLRDPRSTGRDWWDVRTRHGYDWCNFHKFRATVASRLLAAGVDPARVADHMGHARPSMTLDFYAGRNVITADAARILAR